MLRCVFLSLTTACSAPAPQQIGQPAGGFPDPTLGAGGQGGGTAGGGGTTPGTGTTEVADGVYTETIDGTSSGGGGGGGDGDFVFTQTVHELVLEIPDGSWDVLLDQSWGGGEYVGAYLTTPDGVTSEVGIKLTGQSSFQGITDKPSFKIKMDFFDETVRWDGLKRFNLHNLTWDGSFTAEANAYRLYRDMGLAAPRTSHARLVVNEQLYGLYSLIENYDGQMMDEWFVNDKGNLYEGFGHDMDCCNCFEVDIDDEGNHDALGALCDNVLLSGAAWNEAMKESMDWHALTRALAAEAWVAHWDSYSWNLNNFRLYHEPDLDKFFMMPWSTDLSFGWAGPRTPGDPPSCHTYATDISEYSYGMVASDCRNDEDCIAEVLAGLEEINVLVDASAADWGAQIDEVVALLDPYVQEDTKKAYTVQDFYDQNQCFKDFLVARPAEIRAVYPRL